jgi:hypothetical protein
MFIGPENDIIGNITHATFEYFPRNKVLSPTPNGKLLFTDSKRD